MSQFYVLLVFYLCKYRQIIMNMKNLFSSGSFHRVFYSFFFACIITISFSSKVLKILFTSWFYFLHRLTLLYDYWLVFDFHLCLSFTFSNLFLSYLHFYYVDVEQTTWCEYRFNHRNKILKCIWTIRIDNFFYKFGWLMSIGSA